MKCSNGKWPFIVDFPIKNGDFPLLCGCSPEGIWLLHCQFSRIESLPGDPMHYQRPLHQPWQRGVMEPWGFSAPGSFRPSDRRPQWPLVKPWWGLTDVFAQVYFLQDWGWWCVQGKQLSARKTLNNIEHVEIDMLNMVKTRILISPMNSLPRCDAYWRIVSRFWLSFPVGRGICEWRSNPWVAGWHGLLDEINLPKIWGLLQQPQQL